jgi:hypothetical protein
MYLHRTCQILRALRVDHKFGRESPSYSLVKGKTMWCSPVVVDRTSRMTCHKPYIETWALIPLVINMTQQKRRAIKTNHAGDTIF